MRAQKETEREKERERECVFLAEFFARHPVRAFGNAMCDPLVVRERERESVKQEVYNLYIWRGSNVEPSPSETVRPRCLVDRLSLGPITFPSNYDETRRARYIAVPPLMDVTSAT